MNKKDYKRYKKIGTEIAQLNQDVEDCMAALKDCYETRNLNRAKRFNGSLNYLLKELYKREVIRDELVLPKHMKITNGYQDVQDFIKDNDWEEKESSVIEEYVSNCLLDETNHNLFGFTWVVVGKDIYVTNIRWNQYQTLKCDLKSLLKGSIGIIENDYVKVDKGSVFKGCLLITNKETNHTEQCTLKEAIKELENLYVM